MSRGCSKNEPGKSSSPVDGYTNIESVSTVCNKDKCNGGNGKTTDLVVAEEFEETTSQIVSESANQISHETSNQIAANESTSSEQTEDDSENAAAIEILCNATLLALVLIWLK